MAYEQNSLAIPANETIEQKTYRLNAEADARNKAAAGYPASQLPSTTALNAVAAPNYYSYPGSGQSLYTSGPDVATGQYQTGATGDTSVGSGTITRPAYEQQQQTQLEGLLGTQAAEASAANLSETDKRRAALQADAEQRRLGYIKTLTGQAPAAIGPQGGPAFDENAARAAAFGRAKEQAGQTALASLKALNDVMAEQGLTGSSQESQGVASIVGGGTGAVNNFTRTQLIADLNRAAQIADQNQQNAITQRGQNMSQIPSLVSLLSATGGAY
jgi:hypothetical protein